MGGERPRRQRRVELRVRRPRCPPGPGTTVLHSVGFVGDDYRERGVAHEVPGGIVSPSSMTVLTCPAVCRKMSTGGPLPGLPTAMNGAVSVSNVTVAGNLSGVRERWLCSLRCHRWCRGRRLGLVGIPWWPWHRSGSWACAGFATTSVPTTAATSTSARRQDRNAIVICAPFLPVNFWCLRVYSRGVRTALLTSATSAENRRLPSGDEHRRSPDQFSTDGCGHVLGSRTERTPSTSISNPPTCPRARPHHRRGCTNRSS